MGYVIVGLTELLRHDMIHVYQTRIHAAKEAAMQRDNPGDQISLTDIFTELRHVAACLDAA